MRSLMAVLLAMLFVVPLGTSAATSSPATTNQKAALVTGASSGIGRKITEHLAAKGYFVYAGANRRTSMHST
jgi:hypothetical protein